jgi:hypothetical protein
VIAFVVDDIREAMEEVQAAGLELELGSVEHSYAEPS